MLRELAIDRLSILASIAALDPRAAFGAVEPLPGRIRCALGMMGIVSIVLSGVRRFPKDLSTIRSDRSMHAGELFALAPM